MCDANVGTIIDDQVLLSGGSEATPGDNRKANNHSQLMSTCAPELGPASANSAYRRDGWPHAGKQETLQLGRLEHQGQPQGPGSQGECSSGCDPAKDPNAQEDLETRQRLKLSLEIHGSETQLRWGCRKAAEGSSA